MGQAAGTTPPHAGKGAARYYAIEPPIHISCMSQSPDCMGGNPSAGSLGYRSDVLDSWLVLPWQLQVEWQSFSFMFGWVPGSAKQGSIQTCEMGSSEELNMPTSRDQIQPHRGLYAAPETCLFSGHCNGSLVYVRELEGNSLQSCGIVW